MARPPPRSLTLIRGRARARAMRVRVAVVPWQAVVETCYIMRNFGNYFTGTTYVFLLVQRKSSYCTKVQYFVKYRNTCFRDPITLLSMDIVVERFLEIGASDLLVLTRQLQDPSYRTMRHILILKYWARKAKYHNISHLADCWHFRVTHVKHHTF